MKYRTLILLLMFSITAKANVNLKDQIKKLDWNGIEVVWLEDNRLPVYDILVYFAEGALGDTKGLEGTSEIMFSQLTSGTTRYAQKQIMESLDFYGASYGSSTTHEYSTFEVSGLIKDYIPTMKMICHLFHQATFPDVELKKTKRRIKTGIETMVTNHGELANHIFRNESLKGSGYEVPVMGTLDSINKIGSQNLKNRLKEYNESVKKRIYIKGPKTILGLKNIIVNDCAWKQGKHIADAPKVKKVNDHNSVIFVPIAEANQAQVRIGRILTTEEVKAGNEVIKVFSAKFLGGGFTSELTQEIRVKKGLTYSIGAYASEQKYYGRSGISTFTRDDKIVEMLNSIKSVITEASTTIAKERLEQAKRNIKGNYLLELESTSQLLKSLVMYDHVGKDYSEILKFPEYIDEADISTLQNTIQQVFGWDSQTILVLGSEKVEQSLKDAGYKIRKVNYKNYL